MRFDKCQMKRGIFLAGLALFLFGTVGMQAEEEPLWLNVDQFFVELDAETGEETLVSVDGVEVVSGDIIEYHVWARNNGDHPINDIVLSLRIAPGTQYIEGSEHLDQSIALQQFSIDHGESYRTSPVRYTVEQEDGTREQRVATPDMYTGLRFVFLQPLAADEEVMFTYRVQVL